MALNLHVRPCLFIGVGTTGWDTINEFRRLWYEEFAQAGLPCFRYLVLETNQAKTVDDDFVAGGAAALQDYEKLDPVQLWVPKLEEAKARLAAEEGFTEWVDQRLLKRGDTAFIEGAGGLRQAGRLCLWANWPAVAQKITVAYGQITSDSEGITMQQQVQDALHSYVEGKGDPLPGDFYNPSPVVVICGTLCGGTCSGALLDLAYALRFRWTQGQNPDIYGVFTCPDLAAADDMNNSAGLVNCWAALRELDYYARPETSYKVQFPGLRMPLDQMDFPFKYCYLVSTRNAVNQGFAGRNIAEAVTKLNEMVAMFLFSTMATDLGNQRGLARADYIAQHAGEKDDRGYAKEFRSFGQAAFWFPRYRLAMAVVSAVGAEFAKRWLGQDQVPDDVRISAREDAVALCERVREYFLGTKTMNSTGGGAATGGFTNYASALTALLSQERPTARAMPSTSPSDLHDKMRNLAMSSQFQERGAPAGMGDRFNAVLAVTEHEWQDLLFQRLRAYSVADACVYVEEFFTAISETLAGRGTVREYPATLPAGSPEPKFQHADDLAGDWCTWLLGKRKASLTEYKNAAWEAFAANSRDALDSHARYWTRHLLEAWNKATGDPRGQVHAEVVSKLERLGAVLSHFADNVCAGERRQWLIPPPLENVVFCPGQNGYDNMAAEATARLLTPDVLAGLRKLFVPSTSQAFAFIEPAVGRGRIDDSRRLQKLIDALAGRALKEIQVFGLLDYVHESQLGSMESQCRRAMPYLETDGRIYHEPMLGGGHATRYLVLSDDTTQKAVEISGIAQGHWGEARAVNRVTSPFGHFIFLQAEHLGISLPCLRIAPLGEKALANYEKDPMGGCTAMTHKAGLLFLENDLVEQVWLVVDEGAKWLAPEVFGTDQAKRCLRVKDDSGLETNLVVSDREAVARAVLDGHAEHVVEAVRGKVAALGKIEAADRSNRFAGAFGPEQSAAHHKKAAQLIAMFFPKTATKAP